MCSRKSFREEKQTHRPLQRARAMARDAHPPGHPHLSSSPPPMEKDQLDAAPAADAAAADAEPIASTASHASPPTSPPPLLPPMEKKELDADADADSEVIVYTPKRRTGKKSSALAIFRAALFAMSSCTTVTKKRSALAINSPTASAADGVLKSLVSGMRPLHLQPVRTAADSLFPILPPPPPEAFHDVPLPPPSPASSSVDSMSRYASAEDLQALDGAEENQEEGAGAGGSGDEPNAIDMRAEEFIARFYEQMRLQRLELVNGAGSELVAA